MTTPPTPQTHDDAPQTIGVTVHVVQIEPPANASAMSVLELRGTMARKQREVSRGLINEVLGVDPSTLLRGPFGKPYLQDGPAFNLSDGEGLVALALAQARTESIGVDVEQIVPLTDLMRLTARKVFTSQEVALIEEAPDADAAARRYCEAWTRLEAVLKAQGTGFAIDPRYDEMPTGWKTTTVEHDGHLITVAARQVPRITLVVGGLASSS